MKKNEFYRTPPQIFERHASVGSANAKPGCSRQNTVSTAHPTILKIFHQSFRIAIEDVVRMAIVTSILFIGDFYLTPFYVKSE